MNVKFKDGISGFVWNSGVVEVFTEELSDKERNFIYNMVDRNSCFIGDEEDIVDQLTDGRDVDNEWLVDNGLNEVLELI
jgi:hypothetical protein